MGKIVAVDCSPKADGTSSCITNAFLDGAMGLSTNLITLHRLVKVKSVQDCHYCLDCKSQNRCTINDDLTSVLKDIEDADCVAFSTPVYFGGPCALYKMLEDRMFSFLDSEMKPKLKAGKKAVLIVTSFNKEENLKDVADKLADNLKKFGFEIMGVITYCDNKGLDPVEDNAAILREAKQMGLKMRNTPTV